MKRLSRGLKVRKRRGRRRNKLSRGREREAEPQEEEAEPRQGRGGAEPQEEEAEPQQGREDTADAPAARYESPVDWAEEVQTAMETGAMLRDVFAGKRPWEPLEDPCHWVFASRRLSAVSSLPGWKIWLSSADSNSNEEVRINNPRQIMAMVLDVIVQSRRLPEPGGKQCCSAEISDWLQLEVTALRWQGSSGSCALELQQTGRAP